MALMYTPTFDQDCVYDPTESTGASRRPSSCLAHLPADILFEIARFLNTFSDRLHFSATSTAIYTKVIPSIYAHIQLQGIPQCESTLTMLKNSPLIARHVQSLVIRPEHRRRSKKREYIRTWDFAHVASVLVTGAAKQMDALQCFVWDGEDTLPDDRMWDTLRRSCPNLKFIGTTFGSFLPSPHSHLFNFRDLKGFSLILREGFYVQHLHIPSRESDPVFNKLWDMLITHSPNLAHLTITGDGSSSEPRDVSRLASAYWPHLQSLNLGNVVINNYSPTSTVPPFLAFLERHARIKSISFNGRPLAAFFGNVSTGPAELALLDAKALPELTEFSGSLEHLRALVARGMNIPNDPNAPLNPNPNNNFNLNNVNNPNNGNANNANAPPTASSPLSHTLHTIKFPTPIQLRDLTPLAISSVLGHMHALRDLTIGFWLQSGYDSNGVLRTIVSSCPALERLHLTCGSKPSFYLESFSRTLRMLTKLTSLSLTIVKVPGDEPMHVGASRIALSNPRLHTFTITYLPPSPSTHFSSPPSLTLDPFHPFSQTSFSSLDSKFYGTIEPLEIGHYELISDPHGIPMSLLCWERKRRTYLPSISTITSMGSLISISLANAARLTLFPPMYGGMIAMGGLGGFSGVSGFVNWMMSLCALTWRSPLYPIAPMFHPLPQIPMQMPLPVPPPPPPPAVAPLHAHAFLPHSLPPHISFTLPSLNFLSNLFSFFGLNPGAPAASTRTHKCTSNSTNGMGRGRRWVCELRPSGHPDVPKKAWSEVLLEKGPAGEEARLLAFCAWLLLLAAWGIGRAVW